MESPSVKSPESRAARMAAQTRAEIVDAARSLFAERGYAGTSVAAIAERADVAVQTIYSRIGSKAAIVGALVDSIDEQAGLGDILPKIFSAASQREALAHYARLQRNFQERCGETIGAMFAAAGSDPDVAEFATEGRRRHRSGARRIVEHVASLGPLRDGLEVDVAAAVVAGVTTYESWAEMREHGELSWDDAEAALLDLMCVWLLPDAA